MESSSKPKLSIILCMCNPRFDILEKVGVALARQTLPSDQWELVVVDNNSSPPIKAEWFEHRWPLPVRVIVERKQGVPWGRSRGIDGVRADLILMLDDDNILDEDYLELAVKIAKEEPKIGAFGGVARPLLEIGEPRKWQRALFPYLAIRDYGDQPITSDQDIWGEWEPIGAGMVVRTEVARKFAEYVRNDPMAAGMDRSGKSLLSGYDSLLARCSYRLGYQCSYQPRLKLTHFIKRPRMKMWYLIRLMYGHGRSIVLLNTVLGKPTEKLSWRLLFARLPYRWMKNGFGGVMIWFWDLGYFVECRAKVHSALRR